MKAALIEAYGTDIEIKEIHQPQPGPDQVLIEVHAAGLNPFDNIIRAGYMQEMMPVEFPFILGSDISGVVVGTGAKVSKFKVGDAVYTRTESRDSGAIAEFAVVNEALVTIKPKNLSHEQAASIPMAGLTAWQALVKAGKLSDGQKVLVQAGSGGVGSMAIQIAKYQGAFVATTTSAANAEMVKTLGADLVIDYTSQDFTDMIAGYDLVLDTLGGEVLHNGFKVLKKGGCLVSLMGPDTEGLADKLGVRFVQLFSMPDGAMLAEIGELLEQGTLKPMLDRVFPLEEASAAYDLLQSGHAKGKLVVQIK